MNVTTDELRQVAQVYRNLGKHATEQMLLDTADTIGQLEAENAKLHESLERATGIIADICGECPVSRYEWLSSDGCAEKCGSVTENECWIAYLTGKRWDELGVEVDG